MQRQWTDEDLDRFREIYEHWHAYEKGHRGAKTAEQLARSLRPFGMSKGHMYTFRDNGWRYPGEGTDENEIETLERIARNESDIATLLRQMEELRDRVADLERRPGLTVVPDQQRA